MAKKKKIKDVVIMVAADADGNVVEKTEVSYDDFYDGDGVPVVDSNDYRAHRGIRSLSGQIYNYKGDLQSSFENQYSADGAYIKGREVHADGTITED